MALADHFTGRIAQREYSQEFDFEFIPNYSTITDAETGEVISRWIASYTRNFVTAKVVEQTFRFTGCNATDAHTTTSVSVTDNKGTSWTVPMKTAIVDGSTGTRVMVVEEVYVQRTPISPHMWEVVVTRRGFKYYLNGTAISLSNTPAWIADYV